MIAISSLFIILLSCTDGFSLKSFGSPQKISLRNRLLCQSNRINTVTSNDNNVVIDDLKYMTSEEALKSAIESSTIKNSLLFEDVEYYPDKPTINRFIIANPKGFLSKPQISKLYMSSDPGSLDKSTPLSQYMSMLPVIYIAESHPEYGTLGYILNQPSGKTLGDIYPTFRTLRKSPLLSGGRQKKGNSLTMLHRKPGFPDNRAFKVLPGNYQFRLFFSPDIAMANELITTNDAKANQFKFFEWATVWAPYQLDQEYNQDLWLTVNAPLQVVFDEETCYSSLWLRIARSLFMDKTTT